VQSGILLASLVTAALANLMRLNPSEFSGLSIMAREAARIDMRKNAADIIILTWKRWKGKRLSRTQRNHGRMWHLKAEFQEARIKSMIEIADCVSLSGKLEKISRSTKLINKCVNQLSAVLWRPLEESPLATSGRGTLRSRVPPSEPHSASFRSSSKLLRADSMSSIGSSASVVARRRPRGGSAGPWVPAMCRRARLRGPRRQRPSMPSAGRRLGRTKRLRASSASHCTASKGGGINAVGLCAFRPLECVWNARKGLLN
jgi:hypothetical protein